MNIIPGFSAASDQRIVTKNLKVWLEASFPVSVGNDPNKWLNVMLDNSERITCNFINGGSIYSTNYGGYYNIINQKWGYISPNSQAFLFGTNPFTIEVWAYLANDGEYFKPIISIGQYTDGILFRHQPSNDALFFAGNYWNWDAPTYMPLNTWKHLVISKQETSFNLYVNGVSVLSDANPPVFGTGVPESIIPAVPDSYVGASSHDTEEFWLGFIGSYRVYNGTALTQAEVLNNFNATRYRFGV